MNRSHKPSYFGDAYLDIYSRLMTDPEEVEMEADFVIDALGLNKNDLLLDLACGFGKHMVFFRERGISTFGLDINLDYLLHASRVENLSGKLVRGDMGVIPFSDNTFDAVACLFNSFGYYSEDHPESYMDILKENSRILKPGARFFLEVPNKRPVVNMVKHNQQTIQCGEEYMIHEFWDYEKETELLYNKTAFHINGESRTGQYTLRLFTKGQLKKILRKCGFEVENIYGDYDGSAWSLAGSPHMLFVARKRG